MAWQHNLRMIGVGGVLIAYAIYRVTPRMHTPAFVVAVTAIIALVAPEVLDSLPFGPSK